MSLLRAVLFDLCDTLVHFDSARLPLVEVDNQPTRTTARAIYTAIGTSPRVRFEEFLSCLKTVTAEIAAQRDRDFCEVTSQERFRRVLDRLGLPASDSETMRLVDAHMTRLVRALVAPAHHRSVLSGLARRYRLGIVTNFDHAPAVRLVLAREGLDVYFDAVVISGEIGWRKPHRTLFDTALQCLGISAEEAVFVGDNLAFDVIGASDAGLAAIWYRRGSGEAAQSSHPVITDLADLPDFLDS